MKNHVASVHEGKKQFKCDICDYRCSKKGAISQPTINAHVTTVHEEKSDSNVTSLITAGFESKTLNNMLKEYVKISKKLFKMTFTSVNERKKTFQILHLLLQKNVNLFDSC